MNHQYIVLPNQGAHGPHIPLGVLKGTGQNTHYVKIPGTGKLHQNGLSGKRRVKPVVKVALGAYSTRDEVYLPAPASSGSHNFFNKGYSTIKIRETPGLGIAGVTGNKHYQLSPSHSAFDFANQFVVPGSGDNFFRHYTSLPNSGFTGKPAEPHFPIQIQSDDYIRNLVPPPYKYYQEKNKLKNKLNLKSKEPITESNIIINNAEVNKPASVQHAEYTPHSIDVQISPPQDPANAFGKQPNKEENNQKAVEVQVTKAKLHAFHSTVPPYNSGIENANFNTYKTINSPNDTPPPLPSLQTYEVTEGNPWQDSLFQTQFSTRIPEVSIKNEQSRLPSSLKPPTESESSVSPFLPTPFKSDSLTPTSPTQSEVSTIFTKLSLKQKVQATANPLFFDVKEVSTHYPVLGNPIPEYTQEQVNPNKNTDVPNEITINKQQFDREKQVSDSDPQVTIPSGPSGPSPKKNRLKHRQRRPGLRPRTTTEEPTAVTDVEIEKTNDEAVQKPIRQRRPIRYRTTTPSPSNEDLPAQVINTDNYRRRPNQRYRQRPTTESSPVDQSNSNDNNENERPDNMLQIVEQTTQRFVDEESSVRHTTDDNNVSNSELDSTTASTAQIKEERNRNRRPYETQSEYSNEAYQSTSAPNGDPTENGQVTSSKQYELQDEEIVTTTTSTTTTTKEPTTTKSNRIRGRPIKYDTHNRPRFSVKDYRQRLSQYTSTTTDTPKASTDSSTRTKYLNRFRRPTSTAQTEASDKNESSKTKSKESVATDRTSEAIITDKQVKAVNTRLRPFGRYRSTTEPTSTTASSKVTIRSNIFSNLRRPTPISLRKRIYNKQKNSTSEITTTEAVPVTEEENETELSNVVETTIPYSNQIQTESSTELNVPDSEEDDLPDFMSDEESEEAPTTSADILRSDTFLQRVSDLTSSAKNEYDTPGLFKSVSPTSRRVPSYFTIATDDPILPIETFFANIKDSNSGNSKS